MARNWTVLLWRPATQIFVGAIGLILLSLVCFRTGLTLAPTGMAFLVLITSLSLTGSFIGSFVLSVVAVGLLNYYFTEPLFEFRIDYPQDILFLVTFLATSVIVTRLVARLQRGAETLRENEAQWRDVFEHNPVMYFMLDATGTVQRVNGFGAAQVGYTVDELIGQSVLKVFLEEDHETVKKNVAACLQDIGRSHSWEIRKVRKDGTSLWVRENAKAVCTSDKQVIVLIACEDITERRRNRRGTARKR